MHQPPRRRMFALLACVVVAPGTLVGSLATVGQSLAVPMSVLIVGVYGAVAALAVRGRIWRTGRWPWLYPLFLCLVHPYYLGFSGETLAEAYLASMPFWLLSGLMGLIIVSLATDGRS